MNNIFHFRFGGEPRLATCKWPGSAAGFGLLFFLLIFLFSCTQRQESSSRIMKEDETNFIIDALGRPYIKSDKPERIVSLVPAATEILFAIGAGEQVVGVTQYCDYPEEAKSRTSVGGFSGASMSLEIIRDLAPDLVVLSADMHGRIVLLLDELGIPSFAVEPGNFLEVYNVISTLGEICGCMNGAENAITGMKEKIANAETKIIGLEKTRVFWVLSEEPLMTVGRETFVSEIIELSGGTNIFNDVHEKWPLISPEQILVRNPDWILAGNDISLKFTNANSFWGLFPAVKEGRVAIVEADILYRYGPRLADGVEAVMKILHPEL